MCFRLQVRGGSHLLCWVPWKELTSCWLNARNNPRYGNMTSVKNSVYIACVKFSRYERTCACSVGVTCAGPPFQVASPGIVLGPSVAEECVIMELTIGIVSMTFFLINFPVRVPARCFRGIRIFLPVHLQWKWLWSCRMIESGFLLF
jgi:hypothetical protein